MFIENEFLFFGGGDGKDGKGTGQELFLWRHYIQKIVTNYLKNILRRNIRYLLIFPVL